MKLSNQNDDHHFLELFLEMGEIVVDQFIENPIAKEIPVVGSALKICKAVDDIRNRVFLAKLKKFIDTIECAGETTRKKWREKCSSSTDELKKVGESVFLVLERTSDLRKPEIYGILFLAFVDDVITSSELSRLCQAVDMSFVDDLEQLFSSQDPPKGSSELWMQYLSTACLSEPSQWTADRDITNLFDTSELGRKLIEAYRHGKRKVAESMQRGGL